MGIRFGCEDVVSTHLVALNVLKQFQPFLESQAKEELGILWNFKDDLKEMEETLVMIEAVLQDAETKSNKEKSVQLWLAKLRDACYDIQDLLDQYMFQHKQQNGHDQLGCVVPVKVCVRSLHSRIVLAHKMKSMRARLNNIAESKNKFALKENTVLNMKMIDQNRETSSAPESMVLGRDKEHNEIVNMIINKQNSEHIYVLPIFGMGGLGKTTLASLIFNDSRLRDSKHFDKWAWAYVSVEFDLCNIGSRIISSLKDSNFKSDNLQYISQELKNEVTGKRCLIVLDDVWMVDMDLWRKLVNMLIDSSKGITIIVTTRIEKTAIDIASDVPYPLNILSEDNCILLFQKKAFKSETERKEHDNLVKIGKDIAKKCGGVALVANALGSMLCSQRNENIWIYVRDSEVWELHSDNLLQLSTSTQNSQSQSHNSILSGLHLSYNLMPAELKPCFAYCSTYPKGRRISSHKLVQHWISLNFIRSDNSSHNSILSLHDIAQVYLEKLISLSFLQRSKRIYQFENDAVLMHDLMHDLARHIAKDHDIKIVVDIKNTQDANMNSPRYISIYGLKAASDRSEIDIVDGKVRAISLYSDNVKLKEMSFLRVLEAEGHKVNLPKKLKQLHYFSASYIPKEISLPNLKFLHLVGAQFEALPESIGNFERLQYLDLSYCRNLATLPKSISYFQKLFHLDLHSCIKLEKLPECFGNLDILQYINLSYCRSLVTLPDSIGNLKSLQHLNLSRCSNLETLPESIGNLKKLSHLDLSECSVLVELPECFGNLESLQYLNLQHCRNITTLPQSIGKLHRLVLLNLISLSKLKELPECFGNLESLQHLNLRDCSNLMKLPECFGNLKSLQYLNLSDCKNLETLPKSTVNLQKLNSLDLLGCSKLGKLPERFSNLTNLERLVLCNVNQVQDLPRLLIDLTSLRHLIVSSFIWDPKLLSTSSVKLLRQLSKFETLKLDLDITIKEEDEDAEGREQGDKHYCCNIVCLENLNMLEGELTLQGLEKVKNPRDAERANLKEKHKVKKLELVWNGDDLDDDHATAVLKSLQPCPELGRLIISGYGGSQWPTWMMPHLVVLVLVKIPRLKKIAFGRSQFPWLNELCIAECPCLSYISLPPSTINLHLRDNVGLLLSPAAMIEASCLGTLKVVNCAQLVALPEYFGKLSSLQRLEIFFCPNIQSLPDSMRQLTQLQKLEIFGCNENFEKDCVDPKSENWSRIQGIPFVDIDSTW